MTEEVFSRAAHQCPGVGHVSSRIHDDEPFEVVNYPVFVAILVRPGFTADIRRERVQARREFIIAASQAAVLDVIAGGHQHGPCQGSQQESRNSSKIPCFHDAAPLKQGRFINVQGIDSTSNSLIVLKFLYTCRRVYGSRIVSELTVSAGQRVDAGQETNR
jgi:hypothetical protein